MVKRRGISGVKESGDKNLVVGFWWYQRWQMIGRVRRRRLPFNHPSTVSPGAGLSILGLTEIKN